MIVYTGAAEAQGRGGTRGGSGFAAAPRAAAPQAGAPRAAAPNAGPRATIGRPPAANPPSTFVIRPQPRFPFARGTFIRPTVVLPTASSWQPFLWSAPVYGGSIYAAPIYPATSYAPVENPALESNQVNELSYEVERLSEEVRRLRYEQELRQPQPIPSEPRTSYERPAPPTILVFRDGREIEAHGYAIVGQTLWILTEQSSTKVSLSDLDLDATQKRNAERGIRFLLPR